MTDIVTVGSPVLGPLVDRLILRPYLRRMIMERNTHLLRALDAQQAGPDSR